MPKFNREWIVQPHGPVERIDDGLLSVAAEIAMPLGNFPRRMTVAVLRGGELAVWSPVPLKEPAMREIEALGRIAWLIVPGIGHRLDIQAWKARYPEARILCTSGARSAVEEVVPVDAVETPWEDPNVRLVAVPGVAEKEAALEVRRGDRLSLLVNDIIANVRHPHGIGAKIFARLMGFGVHRPQMPHIGKKMFLKDGKALAAWMRGQAADPTLKRLIVSHGDIIEAPAAALTHIADQLAPAPNTCRSP